MISADFSGPTIVDNEGIKALLTKIADSHPWNQTWWGQLVMFIITTMLGWGLGYFQGKFAGFKAGLGASHEKPIKLEKLPSYKDRPLLPPSEPIA